MAKAKQEIKKLDAQHQEHIAQALADCKDLQILIRSTQQRIGKLKAERELATDVNETHRLSQEIKECEEDLILKRRQFEQAANVLEESKTSLKREKTRIREETAEILSLSARWRESAIQRKMNQDLKDFPAIYDRYHATPCPKTFAPLLKMHEDSRQRVTQIEQQRENLKQMTVDLTKIIETLRQKTMAARAEGDMLTAMQALREQTSFEELLQSTQESLQQAEETLVAVYEAFARSEAFIERESARFKA
jgi:phage shock protein A